MEMRRFGRTDLEVSRLTFGCGAVGGLMGGEILRIGPGGRVGPCNGINFFDTASYGNGVSAISGRHLMVIRTELSSSRSELLPMKWVISPVRLPGH